MTRQNVSIIRSVVFICAILAFLMPLYTMSWKVDQYDSEVYSSSGNQVRINGFGIEIYNMTFREDAKRVYAEKIDLDSIPEGNDGQVVKDISGGIGLSTLLSIIMQLISMIAIYKNNSKLSLIFAIFTIIFFIGIMSFTLMLKGILEQNVESAYRQVYKDSGEYPQFTDGEFFFPGFPVRTDDGSFKAVNILFISNIGFGFILLALGVLLNFISFFIKADEPLNAKNKEPILSQTIYVSQPPQSQQPQQQQTPQFPQQPAPLAPQRREVRHCPECGQARKENERYCTYCGKEFKD